MKKFKRLLAGIMAFTLCLAFVGCGEEASTDDASSVKEETVTVISTDDIEDIPDGAETELLYMGVDDLNPSSTQEKSTALNLFEDKGGTISWSRVTVSNKFTKLAAAVTSGKDVPDLFKYELGMTFPYQVIQGFYQPINDVVDFDNALWSGVKDNADQYMLGDDYYVAPINYSASSFVFYNRDFITDAGLDDPLDLYYAGEWTIDTMEEMMSEWCMGAATDETRYGINGYYAMHLVQKTGETMVVRNDDGTYSSNIDSAKIASVQERISDWYKNGYVLSDWIGSAREAFGLNVLFYPMGAWAATAQGNLAPKDDENWGVVPIPDDATYEGDKPITTAVLEAYMWVKGSEKDEAVKVFYECYRIAAIDPDYQQNTKDKWLANNENWTEEDYDVMMAVSDPDENIMLFDPAFGLSALMGDDYGSFRSGSGLALWLYNCCKEPDQVDNVVYTWTQIKETYSSVVDGEIDTINSELEEFLQAG
ncbi:MAG: ABC transporter substrate-binding protein [Ruminococcus sp.]|nr:ABC transporter substrate-binding protein [Ruminococcus sp.]